MGERVYGKHFESMYSGSMVGSGLAVFAVWGYVISHVRRGTVELNAKLLSMILGCTEADVAEAIKILSSPDPKSRSKDEKGRRIIQEAEFQFRVVNATHYQNIRNEDERRQYNREKQAEYRARKKMSMTNVHTGNCVPPCTHAEADAEAEAEAEAKALKTPLTPHEKSDEDNPFPKRKEGSSVQITEATLLATRAKDFLKTPQSINTIRDHIVAAYAQGAKPEVVAAQVEDKGNIGLPIWDVLKITTRGCDMRNRAEAQLERVAQRKKEREQRERSQ